MTDKSKINIENYNADERIKKIRKPPEDALKKITGGRLKGKSDINPQWRIDIMNETFGPIGFGWKYQVIRQWLEPGSKSQIAAFVNIELRYKLNGEWSEPIPGTGGSMFVEEERGGLYTSDEALKMATTDALSVALKAIGVAADVYRGILDDSKYSKTKPEPVKNTTGKPKLNDKQCQEAYDRIATGELKLLDQIENQMTVTKQQREYLELAGSTFERKVAELQQETTENPQP